MKFTEVSVVGIAHVDAPIVVSSAEFEKQLLPTAERIGIPPGMLEHVAGIHERRWWPEDMMPSDAAVLAAEKLFEETGIDRSRVGIVMNTSVCRDFIEPSTAAIVHSKLGLPGHCLNMDIGNACLAFVNAMDLAGMMIERGRSLCPHRRR